MRNPHLPLEPRTELIIRELYRNRILLKGLYQWLCIRTLGHGFHDIRKEGGEKFPAAGSRAPLRSATQKKGQVRDNAGLCKALLSTTLIMQLLGVLFPEPCSEWSVFLCVAPRLSSDCLSLRLVMQQAMPRIS